jgi:hypothetical protein
MDNLTTKQLAERWGITPQALNNMRSAKTGPTYFTIGDGKKPRVRYRIGDVEDYEKEHTQEG